MLGITGFIDPDFIGYKKTRLPVSFNVLPRFKIIYGKIKILNYALV
jgi:hypothetical protein